MKLFLLAFLVTVACAAADDEWKPKTIDEMKTINTACLEEVPLTEEQKGHIKNFEYPNEETVRKFLMCRSVKMGLFCTDAGYNTDRVAKQYKMDLEESDIKSASDNCITTNPKGDKENDVHAYEVHTCFMDSEIGQKLKTHIKKRKDEMWHES